MGRHRRGGRATLWAHRDFLRLWGAESVSQLGTQISMIALPLVAVQTLDASTFQVGLLTAAESLAFLLVGLPAGAWVDRWRRRPVMVIADWGRAVLLASIPAAGLLGAVTMGQLYVVALLTGVLTVFFDVAYQSYLPSLVGREHLVEGNAKLQSSQSVAQVLGPGLGGWLVQLCTAPVAVLADAVSYVGSALGVTSIRMVEPAPEVGERQRRRLLKEIGEGMRFVFGQRLLWAIAGCTGTANFFGAASMAVTVPFLVRDVGLSAGALGTLFSLGSIGGIVGALTASAVARRIGSARTIWLSMTVTGPMMLLGPLTQPGWRVILYGISFLGFSYGVVVYNVAQVSFRQALCPPRLLGRMNATMRFLVWGTMPLGGLVGGIVGQAIGPRDGLWFAAAGGTLAPAWTILSPLRRLRDVPSAPVADTLPAQPGTPGTPSAPPEPAVPPGPPTVPPGPPTVSEVPAVTPVGTAGGMPAE